MIQTAEQVVDLDRHRLQLATLKEKYQHADPYPHIVIENFLNPDVLDKCITEFNALNDTDGWINYVHYNEKKRGLNKLELLPAHIQKTIQALNTPFISGSHNSNLPPHSSCQSLFRYTRILILRCQ